MLDRLVTRYRAWQHRNGKGLTLYPPTPHHSTGWCPTHRQCRGRLYRRDLWLINRRTRGPAHYRPS